MSMIDKLRQLPTTSLMLIIAGKFFAGVGIGVLLINYLAGYGWWLILLAVITSLPGAYRILFVK